MDVRVIGTNPNPGSDDSTCKFDSVVKNLSPLSSTTETTTKSQKSEALNDFFEVNKFRLKGIAFILAGIVVLPATFISSSSY
jgi:hypothetical protein